MNADKKIKVIVCGVGFGNFYLRALEGLKDELELAGILSRGSTESKLYADKYGIPLFTNIEELPDDIDMACVVIKTEVMGGSGEKIAIQLMRKGINVILEHPIHYKNIVNCYKEASKNKVFFTIGDLYIYLNHIKRMINFIEERKEEILEMDIECSARATFPLLHALTYIKPDMRPIIVNQSNEVLGINQIITGILGNTPFLLRVNNEIDKENPDSYMRMFFTIELILKSGRLRLDDIHGPLIYYPTLYLPFNKQSAVDIQEDFGKIHMHSAEYIGEKIIYPYEKIFNIYWPEAIAENILNFKSIIVGSRGNKKYNSESQKNLLCSQCWQEISRYLHECSIVEYEQSK